jgi:CPA1 family monovalent cation:H+ antiporter
MISSTELLIVAFLGIMLVASYVSQKTRFPYTLVLVFTGILLTVIATSSITSIVLGPSLQQNLQGLVAGIQTVYSQLIAGNEGGLFVGLVVPPLLFEAMTHINSSDLRLVIRPSLALATVGVVVSTLVVGLLLWKVAGLSVYPSFLFAALISPTDTATVLALFRKVRVPSKLATLVDTEAAFNDATGIVIFSIVLASVGLPKVPLIGAIETFGLTFGGGVIVGLGVAFAGELALSAMKDRVAETILTIFVVYGTYLLATAFGFSGLIAVTIVGLYFGNLTIRAAMGPATRESVRLFWEIAAFVGNSIAFLFIGFQTDFFRLVGSIGIIAVAFGAVLLARVASVYPILALFDKRGKEIPRSWKNVTMLGGMRGALSVALVASIPLSALISSSDIETITTMVLGVAFASISIQAALLSGYIRRTFAKDHAEQLEIRLSRTLASIENLQKLRDEGKISDEAFLDELEKDKDELREVLGEIHTSEDTRKILRSRASGLYSTMIGAPMSKAMDVLRRHKMEEPIESIIKTKTPREEEKENDEGDESQKQPGQDQG